MRIALLLFTPITARAAVLPRYTGTATTEHSGNSAPLLDWLQETLPGNAAIALAMFAATLLVFTLLTRGTSWRLAAILVLSCFLLFASAAILSGMQAAMAR